MNATTTRPELAMVDAVAEVPTDEQVISRARAVLRDLSSGDVRQEHTESARRLLNASCGDTAFVEYKARALASVLAAHMRSFGELLELEVEARWSSPMGVLGRERDSMLELDAIGADFLESIGEAGRGHAKRVREAARERWATMQEWPTQEFRLWYPTNGNTIRFVTLLTSTLWDDLVAKRFDDKHPSLSLSVVENSRASLWTQGRVVRVDERTARVVDRTGAVVADVRPTETTAMLPVSLAEELRATRTVAAHRLFRWLVERGHEQRYWTDKRDFREVIVRGGFHGLATELGMRGSKAAHELRLTLEGMQTLLIPLPHGEQGGLLTWSLYSEAPGRAAVLTIILGDALLPDYVFAVRGRTLSARAAHMLVPIPGRMPPMVGGRKNEHAAQATFQVLTMIELRRNASELVRIGGVVMPWARWCAMAERSELPTQMVPLVLERWLRDDVDGPAFLLQVRSGVYTLGRAYARELGALITAGQLQLDGSSRARRRRRRRTA